MDTINVGIIGCGFVGGALKAWLEVNNKDCRLFTSLYEWNVKLRGGEDLGFWFLVSGFWGRQQGGLVE